MAGMKSSGVEGFFDIPINWEVNRMGYVFSFGKGLSITKEDLQDEGIPAVSYGDIHSRYGFEIDPAVNKLRCVDPKYQKSSPNSLLQYGDFVFADTSEDIAGSGNFTYLNSHETTFASYHTITARAKRTVNFRYMAYLFDSEPFRTQIRNNVSGVKVFSITQSILKNAKLLLPPLPEQYAIAAFLNDRCSKVDSIIADLGRQVEILRQYKKALITETVTKGLVENTPMRDSGIVWIGQIPAQWDVKNLRFLGSLQNGISKDGDSFGSGFPFVSYGDVYNNFVLPAGPGGLVESSKSERRLYSVQRGDVFFTRTSETIEEIGFASVCYETIEDATFAGFLIRFRPKSKELLPEFATYYFRANALRNYFVKEMMIVTRASLGQNLLKNLPVLLPSIEEQRQIAAYLDYKCAEIDYLIAEKQRAAEKIRQYKKSLINEYATGKKRVAS